MARGWNSPLRARGRAAGAPPSQDGAFDLPAPVLSVTELCEVITLQLELSPVLRSATVRGEVSESKVVRGGHVFFTIQDASSKFRCVQWASMAGSPIVHGRQYDVSGKVDLYAAAGELRMVVRRAREVDAGDRHRALERLTERLRVEGLFDPARKRLLPEWPSRIGVATSATGAVLQDLTAVIGRRMPLAEVVLAPTAIQGVGATGSIVAAIEALVRANVEVIIIARGGGSFDDLAVFNEEAIARAVRRTSEEHGVPVVSAIGHETDTTLCDHAADVRAPTPSAAGEIVVPDAAVIRAAILARESRAKRAVARALDGCDTAIGRLDRRLEVAAGAIRNRATARVDDLDRRLTALVGGRFEALGNGLSSRDGRARIAMARHIDVVGTRLSIGEDALRLLSPLRVLERGYAIIEAPSGSTVTSVKSLAPGDHVRLRFRDGTAGATVEGIGVGGPEK